MKKLITLFLALSMLLALCACQSQTGTPSNQPSSEPSSAAGTPEPAAVDWPTSTVTVICPSSAGGGTDNTIRAFTDTWASQLGQSVVVTNYDATPVAMSVCAEADKDGYTLVCHQNTAICQYVTGVLDVNPNEDLTLAAALQYMGEQALIVPADAPFNNFDEFIAYAKDHPGEVSVAIDTGGPAQFLWGQVMNECGVELSMVVAANTTDKLTNVSGGFIDCGQVDVAHARSYEDAGVADNLEKQGARAEWYDLETSRQIFQNEFDSILATGKALGIAVVD